MIHHESPAIAPIVIKAGYLLEVLLNYQTIVQIAENASGVDEFVLLSAVLNVIVDTCNCSNQSSLEGESCTLVELV